MYIRIVKIFQYRLSNDPQILYQFKSSRECPGKNLGIKERIKNVCIFINVQAFFKLW